MTTVEHKTLPFAEFIALMAIMMSLVALSIDAILPALGLVEATFEDATPKNVQLVVALLLLGLGVGQIFFGPLSDSFGRKPIVYAGYLVFVIGTIICINSSTFDGLLAGRFLQGFGLAAPRVLTMAIIRDQYAGRSMAQIMSFIMVVFILVPMLAPLIGQGILYFAPWPMIFIAILAIGLISLIWFALRQVETLKPEHRKPFKAKVIWSTFVEVCCHRVAMGYTLTAGLVSGAFITYLGSSQQLFQQAYGLGDAFAWYFSGLAFAIGISSFFNGKMVVKKGMQYMVLRACLLLLVSSLIFLIIALRNQGMPPLSWTTGYLVIAFIAMGIMFGNLNSLAMEPLGHLAGVGAAVVGSLSTLIAATIAIVIAQFSNHTMIPLSLSFLVAACGAGMITLWVEKNRGSDVPCS